MIPKRGADAHTLARTGRSWLAASLALTAALALGFQGCARNPERAPALHQVVIRQFQYQPEVLEVTVGDTVEWLNRDLVPHTVTERSGRWDSESIPPDGSWRTVLRTTGRERYGCRFHPNMQARLEVR
jgi:plastocyanin